MRATFARGCFALTADTTRSRFALAASGDSPRKASFAPTSITTRSAGVRSTQSILLTAPAEVSPERPALMALIGIPSSLALFSISDGNACSGSNPRPAVRLVPKKRTTGVRISVNDLLATVDDSALLAMLMLSFVSLESRALSTFPFAHATIPAHAAIPIIR